LITAALNYAKIKYQDVNLPAVPESDEDFLDHKQVKKFLQAIKGDDCEIAALLALHSLRASEMYHLQAGDITKDGITVKGATVRDKNNKWIDKDTNKNKTSTRTVPIIIPRLLDIIPESGRVVLSRPTAVREHLETICINNKLPVVSLHDLRRTFASLAAYLKWQEETICAVGGWSPGSPIVHKIYIKISDAAISEDAKKMKNYYQITTDKKSGLETP
jgi:integrase